MVKMRSRRGLLATILLLALCGVVQVRAQRTSGTGDAASRWDQIFGQRPFVPIDASRSFLAYCTGRSLREGLLKPGSKVLVLAMGDGPNAIYLAQRGLEVTGLDISGVAIERARKAAASKGVELNTVQADLFSHDLGDGKWDLVTNIYFNPAISTFDRIKKAVRPGGLLLVEGYGADYGGPGPPQWTRYGDNQLLEELAGWRILEYQDGTFTSTWAGGRAVPVIRVLARKPASSD
jgi:SAM-dependent methyltransferase